jgi:RND family efflux transporter MFP subunit
MSILLILSKKENTMKQIVMLAILLLLVCCTQVKDKSEIEASKTTQESVNQVTPVKVIPLTMSVFHHDLIANGTVSSGQSAELKFQTSEKVTRIYVKNGVRVAKGQKIAELDQFRLRNTMLQAQDNLERAKLELQDVLIGQGYSLKDSLSIPSEVMKIAKVRSNYDQSLINFQVADYNLRNAVLYAPFSGVVANLFTKEYNTPSASEAFCTIIDNTHPEVIFNILENEVGIVNVGNPVKISPYAISDYKVSGTITEINPAIDKNGMVRVKARLNSSDKLLDGMNVKVLIQRAISNQLVIPKEAVVLRTNKKVVFTLRKDKAYWNYVSTGLENSSGYVITDGLQAGDSIIYDGNINLAHESPVVVVK